MIFSTILLLLISTNLFGFSPDFKIINDRAPLEFNYLFESLKNSIKNENEKDRLIDISRKLDDSLGLLDKENIYFLMKVEVIKSVLEFKHKKFRNFNVTNSLIQTLENKLNENNNALTSFSIWIYRSIIAELKLRQNAGLITEVPFKEFAFKGVQKTEAMRFARYLNYLIPWIDKIDSLNADQFNSITYEISWTILERLLEKSRIFNQLSSSSSTNTRVSIFNIPTSFLTTVAPSPTPESDLNSVTEMSLQERSEIEKSKAIEQIQNLSPDDLSPLSDELNKELNKRAP